MKTERVGRTLAAFLARDPPFDSVGAAALAAIARGSRMDRFADGEMILDAFRNPSVEVFVVLEAGFVLRGRERLGAAPDWTGSEDSSTNISRSHDVSRVSGTHRRFDFFDAARSRRRLRTANRIYRSS